MISHVGTDGNNHDSEDADWTNHEGKDGINHIGTY